MIRFLLVVATGFAAVYFSNPASISPVNSVLLPLLALACLVYLLLTLMGVTAGTKHRNGRESGSGDGGGWGFGGSSCDSDSSGDCGGGDGGGGD